MPPFLKQLPYSRLFRRFQTMYKNKSSGGIACLQRSQKRWKIPLREIPMDLVDELILCDDASKRQHRCAGKAIGHSTRHPTYRQQRLWRQPKSLYIKALELNADIVITSCTPIINTPQTHTEHGQHHWWRFIPGCIGHGRILGKGAPGGMPLYKYIANRFWQVFRIQVSMVTNFQNTIPAIAHSSREVLQAIHYEGNSDDFIFDNQMLSQIIYKGFDIAEVTCPTKYFWRSSSINLHAVLNTGWEFWVSVTHMLCKAGLMKSALYRWWKIWWSKNYSPTAIIYLLPFGFMPCECSGAFKTAHKFWIWTVFPDGDEDLEFLNRLLLSLKMTTTFYFTLKSEESVFDTSYLGRLHEITLGASFPLCGNITEHHIYPVSGKTPFGYSTLPLVHKNDPVLLKSDSLALDQRWTCKGYFVSKDMKSAAVVIKTKTTSMSVRQSARRASRCCWTTMVLLGTMCICWAEFFQSELVASKKER